MLLIDSSWIIGSQRQQQGVRNLLRPYLEAGQLATCGVVRAEVLRGIIKPAARDDLAGWFSQMIEVPTDAVWQEVIELAWGLARRGVTLPLPDIIIAACALHADADIVSLDAHFTYIPGLTVHRTLP